MSLKICIFLPLFCLIFIGCSFTPNELKVAERIMESNPDSALHILQHINPQKYKSDSHKALYGLLLFQALENNEMTLQPDSLLNFSLKYYEKSDEKSNLSKCYFYQARIYKKAQRHDEATLLYFKALDCCEDKTDYTLLGKIYGDMGDVCSIQGNYREALNKYQLSIGYFKKAGKLTDVCYSIICIGRTYRFEKDYKIALQYYRKALSLTKDSMMSGVVFQEIGGNYYWSKQYDSAQYYLRKSLRFPYRNTNYAVRCFLLADLSFDLEQYDSAHYYALAALKYPANFFTKRDCYRILVNIEYIRNDIKQMGKYIIQYQNYGDSIRKVESQTKSTVLESLHNTNEEANGSKRNMGLIAAILAIVVLFSVWIVYFLYKRNKLKKEQLELINQQLVIKQQFVCQSLSKKIEDTKALQAEVRRDALPEERIRLNKDLYISTLHLNDWDLFKREMNHAFNQIIDTLETDYPTITKKEITWCCFQLLGISNEDRVLLLDTSSDGLYKLKQRLAKKMNLKNTKELDSFLKKTTTINA